ncbi:MFS transporter [Haloarcula sp. CBA1131]|uniref:MFS transporter n=1 Tax=Haloarcula sp. CBA1131 TaxID=1853686 RepID=UPI00124421A2|nr:MFS transporter [Haloarcula sp. CBA1131]KAA9400628.1 MFS transporter [Haloarcula sp. CBA1131]
MTADDITTGRFAALSHLRRYDALALTALVWFLGKFLRYAFPPLFGQFQTIYGVSRTALGAAFTSLMLVYAAMQFPSGLVADRVGSVGVITVGGVVTGLGALALVVDAPFAVLAGAMLLIGAGTGTYKTVAIELLARIYPSETGRALGVFDTVGSLAGVAAPAAVVAAAALPGVFGAPWRTLFLAGGLAALGIALAFLVRVPRHLEGQQTTASGSDGAPQLREYITLFRRPKFSAFVTVTILFSFVYNGLVAFLPLYLTSAGGLPSVTANLLFSSLFAVSLVQLVTGEASDRVGVLPLLAGTLVAATAGLVGLVVLSGTAGAIALGASVVVLGIGAHGYRPVRGAYLVAVLPESVAKGSLGVVRTLLVAAGAIGPAAVGYLSEVSGFRVAFGVLTAVLGAAAALTVLLWVIER